MKKALVAFLLLSGNASAHCVPAQDATCGAVRHYEQDSTKQDPRDSDNWTDDQDRDHHHKHKED